MKKTLPTPKKIVIWAAILLSLFTLIYVSLDTYYSTPDRTEYYVEDATGKKMQIAVVSEDRLSHKKDLYLNVDGETYKNQDQQTIDLSLSMTSNYLTQGQLELKYRHLPFGNKGIHSDGNAVRMDSNNQPRIVTVEN